MTNTNPTPTQQETLEPQLAPDACYCCRESGCQGGCRCSRPEEDWNVRAAVAGPRATYKSAHAARYMMTHAVHPDIVVLWFLALKSHWFDNPTNVFFGMREQAKAYLYKWVETGELADDHTTLEITTRGKFGEWLESSWTTAAASSATPAESELRVVDMAEPKSETEPICIHCGRELESREFGPPINDITWSHVHNGVVWCDWTAPPESAGEQERETKVIDWLGDMEVRPITPPTSTSDSARRAANREQAQEIVIATEHRLGRKFDALARHELADRIAAALDAAAPAGNDAERDEIEAIRARAYNTPLFSAETYAHDIRRLLRLLTTTKRAR